VNFIFHRSPRLEFDPAWLQPPTKLTSLYQERFTAMEERAVARRKAAEFYRQKARQALLERIPAI
jgi:hypothetical protein